ncbi:hypothetical protein SAMN05444336_102580 [Albimonas donghaensis]|uniref:Uncharacterized protein n=1 Tax=Albimonas donghaensis TaxID=356660 RepID=A0A1H2X3V0_9RHOB|nr:hypothetical protein [Albimonas donghaensis]SDW86939.1 hypothetical protein SAMN05444336_102580 [Albimonas donghaensis]
MSLIADGLMIAAALVSAIYCHVLAGRLRKLKELDGGVGQAIAALVAQVEEMRTALRATRAAAGESTRTLSERTARAEMAAGRLELLLASLHDKDGASPVNIAARRAGRAGFGGGGGGASGAAAATPLRAVATARKPIFAAPEPGTDLENDVAAQGVAAFDEDAIADSAEAGPSVDAESAASTPTRRLFKIEAIPDEQRHAAPASENATGEALDDVADTLSGDDSKPGADAAPRDGLEAAAALRKALEALARETSE